MKTWRILITSHAIIFSLFLALSVNLAKAQDTHPNLPVYIVQAGDSLWDIAQRFHVSMEELAGLNGIVNPNQLVVGTQLVIPGLEGVEGILTTRTVSFGETLRSISRRYHLSEMQLARLNHTISPMEIYAGTSLIIPEKDATAISLDRAIVEQGQSLLELAVRENVNPWMIVQTNQYTATWQSLPGSVVLIPGKAGEGPSGLPGEIQSVEINPLPFLQGKTVVLRVITREEINLRGNLMEHELHFSPENPNRYIAMQGVHAMADPGLYQLTITGTLKNATAFSFSQLAAVGRVEYPYDKPLTVDKATIDPSVTKPEDAQWNALASPVTPEKFWSGKFIIPSPLPEDYCLETNQCWSSRFGNRRSYNGSAYTYFHTGLDIVGRQGTEIYAPAAGVVVFAGPLTVRGNATMIDHGWGIYSGYMHQSEIYVKVGDRVEPGQLIGLVGRTGRVEGPHLHWEVWVGGIQVDPLDWLALTYP